jgi:tRNA-specific 2-thiouridylase
MKRRVVVAMSGGVDSSVSAAILKEQGYDVIGVFMKNWSQPVGRDGFCPWVIDQKDVIKVCDQLAIPCYTFNFEKEYEDRVVEYFFKEYAAGRTPNPDVMCNKEVKFDVFRKKAKALGAEMIATGHYARLKNGSKGYSHLYKGIDQEKDQSYFLWMLGQEELGDTLFPVGDLTKKEVRELAKKFGLATAAKKDSQGICFIGPIRVREFLKTRLTPKNGKVIYDGKVIGEHEGVWFYTIGQRLGIDKIDWPNTDVPVLYVKEKNLKDNVLIVGLESELYGSSLICDNINWIGEIPELPIDLEVTIRYRHKSVPAKLMKAESGIKVVFKEPQRAITPGQSIVFYQNDELIGGGIIK